MKVAVNNYHSDNRVFTAEAFTASNKEGGRSQTFNGVGAQHKNAETERSIQTVVYMARTFMINCALYQGENGSDNLTLLSFVLDHVAWLYKDPSNARWIDAF